MKHPDSGESALQLLRKIGFGTSVELDEFGKGRNETYTATLPDGEKAFVKRLRGVEVDVRARLARSVSFHHASEVSGSPVSTASLLGFSKSQAIIVHEWIKGAEGLDERADEGFIDEEKAHLCGTLLGRLHAWNIPDETALDTSLLATPSAERFNILPADIYTNSSGAEIQFFTMLQRDMDLLDSLKKLRRSESRIKGNPVHGDVRLDQFLLTREELFLIDWEECRIGDPARDVGAFIGDMVFRTLLKVFTDEGLQKSADEGADLRGEILEVGAAGIESGADLLGAFLDAYHSTHDVRDEDFQDRVVSWSGWHLLDRVIANAQRSHHLPATMKGTAGIGRAALLMPSRHASSFGFAGGSS